MLKFSFTFLLAFFINSFQAQILISSNLPIISINTSSVILDEPKVDATMKIIYNGDGIRNLANSSTPHFFGTIGIELRGQSSQDLFPKKSYGIEIRDASGEDLDTSLLDMPKESDWVIHSPYSDKSLLRNALSYYWAGKIMDYAPRIKFCELILNGQYQGVVLFTEKIKRDNKRVDISKLNPDETTGDDLTGGYIIKFDKGYEIAWISPYPPGPGSTKETRFLYHYPKRDNIVSEQKEYIKSFITQFEHSLMADDFADPLNGYRQYIDINTFVEMMLVVELTRNVDGYRLSTYMYKDRDNKDGRLKMGPVWDYNLALGNANYCHGGNTSGWAWSFNNVCPDDYWQNHFWWERLISDPGYSTEFANRWQELRQGIFSDIQLSNAIDSMANLLQEAQVRNFQKWPILNEYVWPNDYVGGSYSNEINYLKNWLSDRTSWIDANTAQWTTTLDSEPDISKLLYKIYPNPSQGIIIIQSTRESGNETSLRIYDVHGRVVFTRKLDDYSYDLSIEARLEKGLYFYQIQNSKSLLQSGKLLITY